METTSIAREILSCISCGHSTDSTRKVGFWEGVPKCLKCLLDENILKWEDGFIWWIVDPETLDWFHPTIPYWEEQYQKFKIATAKEYWYFLTWTHNDNHSIEDVWLNMKKFSERDMGFLYLDCVLEHGEESGRAHYHMRVKTTRPIKKQKVQHYTKVGTIDFITIRKHTRENWENLAGYMSKESEIIILFESSS